jgi:hypothetical protein
MTKENAIKQTTLRLAIMKAGGAYQFWRKLSEAVGVQDFKLQYGDKGFEEKGVGGKKGFLSVWYGGDKAWSDKDNPMGKGFVGGKFIVGRDKKGISAYL